MTDLRFTMGKNPQIRLRTPVSELKGEQGLSAYEVALENGFEGSEEEWLLSLKGDKGERGEHGDTLVIKGAYPSLDSLKEVHPVGEIGDAYAVSSGDDSLIYIWDTNELEWVCIGGVWNDDRIEDIYNNMVQMVNSLGGVWFSFTDKDGNLTTEPCLHWNTDENGIPITTPTFVPPAADDTDGSGAEGKSAYEIWLEQGNTGTEQDFLNSLKGKDYVLTETDKEEIAEMAAEKVDVPEGSVTEKWVNENFQPKGNYLEEVPEGYVTDTELEAKGFQTAQQVEDYAQPKGDYITETALEQKGYQTKQQTDEAYQPKGSYVTTAQLAATEQKIPTKTSDLDNDSGYLKNYTETDPTVPNWAKQADKPIYTKSEVGLSNVANERQYSANNPPPYPVQSINGKTGAVEVEEKGTADTKVTNHNADDGAHNDIRLILKELTTKVNTLLDSDDTTLDQMSEVVAYIKANRELLESYTTEKVNVTDIIDNLTTNVSNKPLSAKQGVQLKALIDAIKVPTKLSELSEDSTHRTVTDSEKNTWNNKSDFSGNYNDLTNKPTKVTQFDNDAGYMKSSEQQTVINNALAQAKNSGEFDGEDGQRGFSILKVTTAPSSYTTETGGFTPTYRIALSTVKSQSKATEVLVGDTLAYNYYQYPIGYVDSSYVYLGERTSIRGATGPAYTLNDADKASIAAEVKDSLVTESWTFTLEDGSTVTKAVYVG